MGFLELLLSVFGITISPIKNCSLCQKRRKVADMVFIPGYGWFCNQDEAEEYWTHGQW